MKICTNTLESFSGELLTTEIRFHIASARATGCDLVCLRSDKALAEEGREIQAILKNLRALKKEGKIDFFADSISFKNSSAEAGYVMNKFPDAACEVSQPGFLFLIKL